MSMRPAFLAAVNPHKETLDLLMQHVGGKMSAAKDACQKPRGDVVQSERLVHEAAASLESLARVAHQMEMMTGRSVGAEMSQFVARSAAELHEMAGHVAFCKVIIHQGNVRKRDRQLEN